MSKAEPMKTHPVAAIFPMMSRAEVQGLALDIADNGLRDPIVTHMGLVLDGRNRMAACEIADVEPTFVKWAPRDKDDTPESWIISKNLHRRHLDESQRAMAAADYAEYLRGHVSSVEKSESDDSTGDDPPARVPVAPQKVASAVFNVSERSVRDAEKVKKEGAPELATAVRQGKAKVKSAAKATSAPKAEQREAAAKGKGAVAALGKKQAESKSSEGFDTKRAAQQAKEWKAISVAVAKLDAALTKAGIIRDKGKLCDQPLADEMARIGKPLIKTPQVYAAACRLTADAMTIVADAAKAAGA